MFRYGTLNGIEYAIREVYVSGGRMREYHFHYRYGTYKQFRFYLGAVRTAIWDFKNEDKFLDEITRILARMCNIKQPRKRQK